ncbi:bifunctional riboflavin kinase/FAD synthetase [bacterium endosymbiont of Bathymodiolus sp. 5 South]|jgi:riboflavin kinase/FMN adenylyltransferase|uniref:bifunctional riboflavin kinase/FAD synthetase n=1 Tax=bacterium endosymbiont of Bathymodiolus sp. 5 South TaxID=1181670 RepID=UPI0010B79AA3|nr:bifunctional riboflavin kinase/FAD synthetase [bacterium endosymbiont of Bathymodiolus sp. 5 South]CAC9635365.1 FMN adenylyltransferase (EC 2.7.7.2) / Riboflavin kinase (EC 2.7.1.26) [uncultured Gammaproteobacteria bacterium]CAC9657703.1 FMN adenylyltransferase (EC 2.7.7.2) / Riboflavin kinase (EC 2.7.1.26) [uncultured Gammaproteobacteria bacterium]SHN89956.1 FMN adenylyltransferase / Riboflavin kinase [bacterium endosymbiont of Bathymodiolus sp. 5 South]SSC08007.1 Riboflavin kinase / FMN ad
MKLIRGLQNLKNYAGSVVTIGNFDGVHIGHKKIISQLVKKSKELGLPSVLISFTPTPQSFFSREQASLSSFKEKHRLLSELDLDTHLIIRFNQAFSQLAAQTFVQEILLNKLNMKYCLIGDDFRFGKERKGSFELLQSLSKDKGFTVKETPSILCNNRRVSSSAIRTLLKSGDTQSASQMLGHAFSITGKIIHGLKNGRAIGFPTINIPIQRKISPVHGIFAVTIELDGATYQGVCSVGNRPIIGGKKTLLEVFLFDFNQRVYGLEAKIIFKHKIREERNFADFKALKQQIELDVQNAKDYLTN